ncbi:cardiolipin synthase [Motilimonas pumila]|uniref:Cardiolipin synthase A n=1 Tax=Motilimonas pumila TaxID=2303987 RepID=A0A418YBD8_9GAMM|nr:cardiolipin synthase [Motilimonas pumila]RJG40257.1 cardiolipin synthase [Motilimonas pumila]
MWLDKALFYLQQGDVWGWVIITFHALIVGSVSLRVIMKRREIGISLSWLAIIYAVPFAGVGFYLLFGELNLGRKRAQRATDMFEPFVQTMEDLKQQLCAKTAVISDIAMPMHKLTESLLNIPSLKGNQLTLLDNTDKILTEIIEQLHNAKHSCFLEFYIWHPGGLADLMAQALCDAAERGVQCRVLLDSVGSKAFFKSAWPKKMRASGVQLVEVLPVGAWRMFLQRQDLRMHRKLISIDKTIAYTGSMNLVDPLYFKKEAGVGEWVDIMVRVQGPAVSFIWAVLACDWEMETGERVIKTIPVQPQQVSGMKGNVQLIPSGPFPKGDCIHQILLTSVYAAKHSLVLTTPYFVPDEGLHAALRAAAQRGVKVKVIMPAKNDSLLVKFAASAFYDELMADGVEIHKFTGGLLHTKSIVVDERVALVGTVNLDRRSFWLNFEITMLIDDADFAGAVLNLQMHYLLASNRLDLQQWRQRSVGRRFVENVCYLFSPLL